MTAMPDLAEITNALFGGFVDVDALVAKMDPGVSDVHVPGGGGNRAVLIPRPTGRRRRQVRKLDDRTKRQTTAGLSVVGAGAGLYGLGVGTNEVLRRGYRAAPKGSLPKVVRQGWRATPKKTKYLIPIEAAGLTGELASAKILHSDAKRMAPVEKTFTEAVDGFIRNSRFMSRLHAPDLVSDGEKVVPKPGSAKAGSERAIAAGQRTREDIGRMAATTSGKVAIGGAGLMAVHSGVKRRRERSVGGYEPMPYAKRDRDDVTFRGTFSKFDDDRRLAFGWANVSKVNGIPVVDRQGDYCAIEDIEDAAYEYVKHSRVGGDMHRRVGGKGVGTIDAPHQVATLVESMVFDDEKCDALGLPDEFPRGWWIGMHVDDDEAWEMAKDGRRTGFSIHGKGIRKSVDYDALMGV